uniref:Putative secreted protein n=1 Tax=Anopheles darlingi TaxID=43151 RepID=A0A2M4DAC1_ANODA
MWPVVVMAIGAWAHVPSRGSAESCPARNRTVSRHLALDGARWAVAGGDRSSSCRYRRHALRLGHDGVAVTLATSQTAVHDGDDGGCSVAAAAAAAATAADAADTDDDDDGDGDGNDDDDGGAVGAAAAAAAATVGAVRLRHLILRCSIVSSDRPLPSSSDGYQARRPSCVHHSIVSGRRTFCGPGPPQIPLRYHRNPVRARDDGHRRHCRTCSSGVPAPRGSSWESVAASPSPYRPTP